MTELSTIVTELRGVMAEERILHQAPLSEYTSMRVGGPAEWLLLPASEEELVCIFDILDRHQIRPFLMGNGSNLIVRDGGIPGFTLRLGEGLARIHVTGTQIEAQAGALLTAVAKAALDHGLTGFEFASGIPGSLGGAVAMNAGAYGGEMKDVLRSVRILEPSGQIREVPLDQLEYGYRTSMLQQGHKGEGSVVLSAVLDLAPGDPVQISSTMRDLRERRNEKQPMQQPSAGSVFKRPEGHYAGQLIQEAGLRGLSLGGARVSPKHCGFIVNEDNATAKDVTDLIEIIRHTVLDHSGVLLEPEVRIVGESTRS